MKKTLFILCLLFSSFYAHAQYGGTNTRGLIQTYDPYYRVYVPLHSATVDLYSYNYSTGQWQIVAHTVSNQNGFYFFYGLIPATYYVQVNRSKNYQIFVQWIDYQYYQFQDLPIFYY